MPFFGGFSAINCISAVQEVRGSKWEIRLSEGAGGTEFLLVIGFFTRVRKLKLFVLKGLTLAFSVRYI
jgi:hypothetical protein